MKSISLSLFSSFLVLRMRDVFIAFFWILSVSFSVYINIYLKLFYFAINLSLIWSNISLSLFLCSLSKRLLNDKWICSFIDAIIKSIWSSSTNLETLRAQLIRNKWLWCLLSYVFYLFRDFFDDCPTLVVQMRRS